MIVYLMAIRLILWNIAYKFEKKMASFPRLNITIFLVYSLTILQIVSVSSANKHQYIHRLFADYSANSQRFFRE